MLDDLAADRLPKVAFVTLKTSPGNFQAWLALPGRLEKEFAGRIRKGAGADIGVTQIAHRLGVLSATLYRYLPAARTANSPGV
jgi:hypothetical protein